MLIEESFIVEAPRPDVARFLLDVPRMTACVPGVEDLNIVGDERYDASLVVRLGPIQARFKGDVVLDAAEAPRTIRARGNGRDGATGSVAQVEFSADLVEKDGVRTEIHIVSDVAIRGRLGQFGSGVVLATAREMIRAFAECAQQSVTTSEMTAPAGQTRPEPTRPPGIVRVLWRGLQGWAIDLWNRLSSRGDETGGDGT